MRIIVVLFLVLLCSCTWDDVFPPNIENWDCDNQITEEEIEQSLLGQWDWFHISCFWTPEQANSEDFLGYSIEFKNNHELIVRQDDQITLITTWTLNNAGSLGVLLNTEVPVDHTRGYILFCGEGLQFFNSYIDGCDNSFVKRT